MGIITIIATPRRLGSLATALSGATTAHLEGMDIIAASTAGEGEGHSVVARMAPTARLDAKDSMVDSVQEVGHSVVAKADFD